MPLAPEVTVTTLGEFEVAVQVHVVAVAVTVIVPGPPAAVALTVRGFTAKRQVSRGLAAIVNGRLDSVEPL